MNNTVRIAMPAFAVRMNLGVADQVTHVGKVALPRDRHVLVRSLSSLATLPFLLLGACAEPQAPPTMAAAPTPVASVAPTPSCNAPPSSQADRQNPATPWLRAVDRERLAECTDALDPRPAPLPPGHLGNPTQEAMDRRTLDLAPAGVPARLFQGGEYRQRIPMPD
jgi:hypothetical protein